MTTKLLCIYHRGCLDGFAAAWAVRQHYGADNVEFHAAIYGEEPPDTTDRHVLLVDFSYKRDVLLQISAKARQVKIFDHHETAQDDLVDLPCNVHEVFDMSRSGAMITWDQLNPGTQAPLLFDYVQDRDLWQFKLPNSREVTAALYSYPMDFEVWDSLMNGGILPLITEGRAILRKHQGDVAALIKATARRAWFGTVEVPIANVPYMFASDVGHELSKGEAFSATYYDDENGRRFSLRSSTEGANVAKIAEAFNGGGHKHAAGFRLTREEAIDFELSGGIFPPDENASGDAVANFPHSSLGEEVAV